MTEKGDKLLEPTPGYTLVELPSTSDAGLTLSREKYEQITEGTLIKSSGKDAITRPQGTTVYFQPHQSGEPIVINDKRYVFIQNNKIMGYKLN
jgi:hypothetical protein